jgi:peptidylprolyl isomerase
MVAYGKRAVVRYRGTLDDGTVFDSTEGIEPLEFVVGAGTVIHGFDTAVARMKVGERVAVTIAAKDAYGAYSEERIESGPMYALPNAKDIKVGKTFYFVTREGLRFPAKILGVDKGVARIDYNHPLAGRDLTFEIELVALMDEGEEIREAEEATKKGAAEGLKMSEGLRMSGQQEVAEG